MGSRHRPGSGHSTRDAMHELVVAVGVPPGQHQAYVAFALELERTMRSGRCQMLDVRSEMSEVRTGPPDFSAGTKGVVARWFERGLSGHLLWMIGERVAGARTKS